METYYTQTGETVTLESKILSKGGEGSIYNIKSSKTFSRGYCAKLYHKAIDLELASQKQRDLFLLEKKMLYMVEHQPDRVEDSMWMLSWPVAVLYNKQKYFVGILMPLAFERSIKLSQLIINTKLPSKSIKSYWQNWTAEDWDKFDVRHPRGLLGRLKLIANVCYPLYQVHRLGTYVFVDLKPDNILVNASGQVSICDIDSIQISEGKKLLFSATACTPDYSPIEKPQDSLFNVSWDNFSLAVIIYKSLFLIHPFTGTCSPPYDHCETTRAMIEAGLYPHGVMSKYFEVISNFHENLKACPQVVRILFLRAFNKGEGWDNPHKRPSAEDWGRMLATEVKKIEQSPISPIDMDYFKQISWRCQTFNNLKERRHEQAQLEFSCILTHNASVPATGIAVLLMRTAVDEFTILQEVDVTIKPRIASVFNFRATHMCSEKKGKYPLYLVIRPKIYKRKELVVGMPEYSEVFSELPKLEVGSLEIVNQISFWRRIFNLS
ncbi:MAG: hypothetical protein Q4A61_06010 [Porphyromonadaceae bacterium]|nr:hypothetical protein [Porphyromonadaceae bacterium]